LAGLAAIWNLPIAQYPEISPPQVTVTAFYPGATGEALQRTVAAPIEEQINGVEGTTYLSSTAANDGSLTITVTFELGTDLDLATVYVQNRVAIAEPRLPEEVRRQGISVRKRSNEITMLVSLRSAGTFDGLYLSNYASLRLRNELTRVDGVGDLVIFGEGDYGMRVWIDPSLLHARGLTTNDVVAAIQAQNVQVAAGLIGAPPTYGNIAFQYTVTTRGRFETAEDFADIILRTDDDGAIVRLSDVAEIELGAQSYTLTSRTDGDPSATIAVYLIPGANAISTVRGLEDAMERLALSFPEGLEYDIPYRSTDVIEASIREVLITLAIAVILVVLTVYVFLQNVRATLIPALTIPVSLIGTFAVMLLMGFSINLLTLFGLVLAIGIVVDDAIVVVENVSRHLADGMAPKEAALKAMTEVSGAVVATT
ncbi:MAG: efflux RND transporter permease subunit, partial [Phycisphaerales bacterium]|nr:efflux RND transporter permease subunit [Phycisphaerales bacterium]